MEVVPLSAISKSTQCAHYEFNLGIVTQHEKALLTLLTQTITSFFLSLHQRAAATTAVAQLHLHSLHAVSQ